MTPASFKVQRSPSQKLKGVKTEILEVIESVVQRRKKKKKGTFRKGQKRPKSNSPHQSGRSPPPRSRKNTH